MPKKKTKPFTAQLSMAESSATIDVTGFIGWDTEAIEFTDLVAKAKEAGASHLTVRINSLGGYCYDGLAIGDCLRNCGMTTTAVVMGTAQSMASYILQCCTERVAHRNATIMFHQPSACVSGTVDEILAQAQYLCGMRDRMFEDMGARCGMSGSELSAEHMTMKIYNAEEALERGFIDKIASADGDLETEDAEEEEEPAAPVEDDQPVQAGGRVYEYARVQMAMAMAADAEEEPAEEPGTEEPGTEEPAEEPGTEEPATEEPGTEEPAVDSATIQAMVAEQVKAAMAQREAELVASFGAPAANLPACSDGGVSGESRGLRFTMEELHAMPAMQRIEVLRGDAELSRRYAQFI